jgi:hypothetical protein
MVAIVALVVTVCFANAASPQTKPKPEKGAQKTQAKAGAADMLAYVNVAAGFGEGFVYLKNIGEMIDQARQSQNPDAMINCALQLLYAEQASGKSSAVVNGASLLDEAAAMAKAQKNAAVLHRIAAIATDKAKAQQYEGMAGDIEKAPKLGPGLGDIVFDNHTPYYILCYVNGRQQATVGPYGEYRCVDVPYGATTLFAQCWLADGTHDTWGSIVTNLPEWTTVRWNLWP